METLRLNNQAASLASQGKQEDAAAYLHHALTTLRDNVEMVSHENGNCCEHSMPSDSSGCQHQVINMLPAAESASQCAPKVAGPCIEGSFEFYDKILVVSFDETKLSASCGQESERRQNFLLATITYNLGNITQQLAMEHGKAWQFKKALRFYNLALATVENIFDEYGFDENLVLLLCSLYNNMGYIHTTNNNHQETKDCLEWLQRTVCAEQFSIAPMSDEDYCFFSLYLTFCSKTQFTTAAAA